MSTLPNLKVLDLRSCRSLDTVSSIQNCTKLTRLFLEECYGLHTLCSEIGHLSQLVQLVLSFCESLESLPDGIGQLKCLKELNLYCCRKLASVPDTICSLVSLKKLDLGGLRIENLPASMKQLSNLTTLRLRGCRRLTCLPELPSSLQYLDAGDCTSLESVATIFTQAENDEYKDLSEEFNFRDCEKLCEEAWLKIIADVKLRIRRMATSLFKQKYSGEPIGFKLCVPGCRVPKWFSYQSEAGCSSVKIKLSPHSSSPIEEEFLGFAFCIVVSDVCAINECESKCHLKTESGLRDLDLSCKRKGYEIYELSLEHLLIWYDWRIESNCSFNEASFNFDQRATKCGVRPLYTQEDADQANTDHNS